MKKNIKKHKKPYLDQHEVTYMSVIFVSSAAIFVSIIVTLIFGLPQSDVCPNYMTVANTSFVLNLIGLIGFIVSICISKKPNEIAAGILGVIVVLFLIPILYLASLGDILDWCDYLRHYN